MARPAEVEVRTCCRPALAPGRTGPAASRAVKGGPEKTRTVRPEGAPAMRLPRLRFTLWRMMAAVAALALLLGLAVTVHRRRERCERLAVYHSIRARAWAEIAWGGRQGCIIIGPWPPRSEEELVQFLTDESGIEAGRALRRCFEQSHRSQAYRRAAARPWTLLVRDFRLLSAPSSGRGTAPGRGTGDPSLIRTAGLGRMRGPVAGDPLTTRSRRSGGRAADQGVRRT
jgi:hypothetical protein